MSHDTPVSAPRLAAPPGACDAHMHVYEPGYEMLADGRHPSQPGTLVRYLEVRERLGLARTVVVAPSAFGTDNRCTLEAMSRLGESARGVAILDPDTSDVEFERLTRLGMRGIRYYTRGGALDWGTVPRMAARAAEFGWHIQLQCASNELTAHEAVLTRLPCDLVIDHMGRFDADTPVSDPDWRLLLRLLHAGRTWVKLSAPYYGSRSGAPRYEDKGRIARELIRAAPERMVWATNWPHPSLQRHFPDEGALLDLVADWTGGDERLRRRILAENAARLYGFD